jgi:hypothetical protein
MTAALSPFSCGIEGVGRPVRLARHWTKSCQKMTPRNAGKPAR